ncbi:MAG: PhzF family phenazine biosynthesis protein [bacterium]|nr:PhzF family phenazine biosynthesis protein [bacterium]
MSQRIIQVDAFTHQPFAGNPAAVCVLAQPVEERWMQLVAREMNLSETAFLTRRDDGGFDLRWFTPRVEVELCGHATLASAHVLWEDGHLQPGEPARFFTRSGVLTATRRDDWIELDFPSRPPEPVTMPAELSPALGVELQWVGKDQEDYLLEVDSEATVRGLQPDFTRLESLSSRGFIVTSRADSPEFDFVSRFFAPAVGIPEDPVTGSAHCCLAPFWAERLGKSDLTGFQASERGGIVRVRPQGERVLIFGQAVTVLRAELVADSNS